MFKKLILFIALILIIRAQILPKDVITKLAKGINIGNTFDAPDGETTWGNPQIQEYYFDDYKTAGFSAIRLPVTWDKHTSTQAPYTIDETFFKRVEQVIDWALKRGFYIIVNAHHEAWIKTDFSATNLERFSSIWTQISTRFKSKSFNLFFEILNEPQTMSLYNLNVVNSKVLAIIRKTNPSRIVVFAGTGWSSDADLKNVKIPSTSDKYLIANFHCYCPWDWASSKDVNLKWGTDSDKAYVKGIFDGIKTAFAGKNIEIMMNEYGAMLSHDYASRMIFYQTYVDNAVSHKMGLFAWDDGGDFRMYDRQLPQNHVNPGKWVGGDIYKVITGKIRYP